MEAIMPVRHSGLQRDVLKLFRDLHRAARKKDPDNSSKLTEFGEFVKKYSSSQDIDRDKQRQLPCHCASGALLCLEC